MELLGTIQLESVALSTARLSEGCLQVLQESHALLWGVLEKHWGVLGKLRGAGGAIVSIEALGSFTTGVLEELRVQGHGESCVPDEAVQLAMASVGQTPWCFRRPGGMHEQGFDLKQYGGWFGACIVGLQGRGAKGGTHGDSSGELIVLVQLAYKVWRPLVPP